MNEKNEKKPDNCIDSLLEAIMNLQHYATIPMFEVILKDTIPLILYTDKHIHPYEAYGCHLNKTFTTIYFRLDEILPSHIVVTLLYPMDEDGDNIPSINCPFALEKTNHKIQICTKDILAIQSISPKLIDRQVIIVNPKN